MADIETVDVQIDPYEHINGIKVNLWLSCDTTFASRYFTKPEMHQYPPESSHAHYIVILVIGFILLSRFHVSAYP